MAARKFSNNERGYVNFEANNRLKFTAEEQRAIQAAERASGGPPQSRIVAQPRPRHGLAYAIVIALAYLLFSEIVAAFHSFSTPEFSRESGAPITEAVQSEPQSQAIQNGSTFTFQNQASIDQPREVISQPSVEPGTDGPVGPPSGVSTQVTGEEP